MQLTGPHLGELSDAFRNAFTPQSLAQMLAYRLNRSLHDHASFHEDFKQVVFQLLGTANREEWIDQLVIAARQANPGNRKLLAFSEQFGLAPVSRQEIQRVIEEGDTFLDPDVFRSRLGQLEPRVCRLEIPSSKGMLSGTAFLVGTSVVMTNYHVVEALIADLEKRPAPDGIVAKAATVRARFDFKRMLDPADQHVIREVPGRTYKLASDWLVDASEGAPLDRPAPPDRLDYALLRLDGAPAAERLDGPGGSIERGFVPLPAADPPLPASASLFILQHPRGGPLKLGLKTRSVLGVFDDGARVRHTTPTERGSSGSPCFTPAWELAALHHSGDPDFDPDTKPATYNEGIPIGAIRALVAQHGRDDQIGV
jgi:hypothetical protein